jgi:hypothetical protein
VFDALEPLALFPGFEKSRRFWVRNGSESRAIADAIPAFIAVAAIAILGRVISH